MTWQERWPHFAPEEVLSPDLVYAFHHLNVVPYSFRALDELERLRFVLGGPIVVNSGLLKLRGGRSPREIVGLNRSLGKPGGSYSFHSWCAFDISVPGMDIAQLKKIVLNTSRFKGVGVYKTFLHIDLRDSLDGKPVIWQGE